MANEWRIEEYRDDRGDRCRIVDTEGCVICAVCGDAFSLRVGQNARLIAAAPDLLLALRAVLPWAEGNHDGAKDCDCDRCLTLRAARAVIATAIGYKA